MASIAAHRKAIEEATAAYSVGSGEQRERRTSGCLVSDTGSVVEGLCCPEGPARATVRLISDGLKTLAVRPLLASIKTVWGSNIFRIFLEGQGVDVPRVDNSA